MLSLRASTCQAVRRRMTGGVGQNLVWFFMSAKNMEGLEEERPSLGYLGVACYDKGLLQSLVRILDERDGHCPNCFI